MHENARFHGNFKMPTSGDKTAVGETMTGSSYSENGHKNDPSHWKHGLYSVPFSCGEKQSKQREPLVILWSWPQREREMEGKKQEVGEIRTTTGGIQNLGV